MSRPFMAVMVIIAVFFLLFSCSKDEEGAEGSSGGGRKQAQADGKDSKRDGKENRYSIYKDSPPVDGDWLIYNLSAEPGTLNPILATDAYESTVNGGNVYETLVKRDNKTLEIVPLLAESWDISPDKLSYTFHLRKDVKWHDGAPFTARDVRFSFEKIFDPKIDSAHLKNYLKDIKKVEALDDYTIRFTYSKLYFLALEVCGGMPIVPKHVFKNGDFNTNPANRKPIGTGPYKFIRWATGEEIVLGRNEDYWGEKPHIMRVVFRIITDSTVALQVLKRGELDRMGLTPIQWEKQTRSDSFNEEFNKLGYFTPNYRFIGWNIKKPFFSEARVRRAMTHLLNRRLILQKILYDLGEVVTNPFYINSPEYDKAIKPYLYDPEKAKSLLEEAGWVDTDGDGLRDKDGVKFEFEFLLPNNSETGEKVATILKEELDSVGINMKIRKTEWAVFVQRLQQRKFEAVTLAWSMGVESDPYQIWHSSQAEQGSNFVGFENKRADELIDEARGEFDRSKRIELYREFAEIVHAEQPYTFLFCGKATVAVSRRFQDVVVYPLGLDPLEWFVQKPLQRYGTALVH
ncbi:MAG: peptide-binding protein [Thermodesulfobacteriota bacterium]